MHNSYANDPEKKSYFNARLVLRKLQSDAKLQGFELEKSNRYKILKMNQNYTDMPSVARSLLSRHMFGSCLIKKIWLKLLDSCVKNK